MGRRLQLGACAHVGRTGWPHLRRTHGNIVFTGSEAGLNGSPDFTPYGGSKGFLHAFMKGVALEQAPYGVRANCVCPGPIDTAWTRGSDSPIPLAAQATIDAMVPLGRRGTPEEIANIFAFLASDEASYVTGALWLADGGVTPAKSDIGTSVPAALRQMPAGKLTLRHSHDGLRNKNVYRAPRPSTAQDGHSVGAEGLNRAPSESPAQRSDRRRNYREQRRCGHSRK